MASISDVLRAQAKRKKSPWNILQLILLWSSWICIGILIGKILFGIQNQLFPKNAILAHSTETSWGLMITSIGFLSLPLGAMLTDFIILSIPSARKDFAQELNGSEQGWLEASMKFYFKTILVFMIIFVPIAVVGFNNYFYVTPEGITLCPLFSINARHYDWEDITKIHAGCSLTDNSYTASYVVYMNDGEKVDLLQSGILRFTSSFDRIKPLIMSNKNIVYDYDLSEITSMKLVNNFPGFPKELIKIIKNED